MRRSRSSLSDTPYIANRYYYGHTSLLDEVRYYPLVQLFIVALFIFFTLYSITIRNKATTEPALGGHGQGDGPSVGHAGVFARRLGGDAERKQYRPADGAGDTKGCGPVEAGVRPVWQDRQQAAAGGEGSGRADSEHGGIYKKRATGRVQFMLVAPGPGKDQLFARYFRPLFDWVIENLLKNALDAMEGKGSITVTSRSWKRRLWWMWPIPAKALPRKSPESLQTRLHHQKEGLGPGPEPVQTYYRAISQGTALCPAVGTWERHDFQDRAEKIDLAAGEVLELRLKTLFLQSLQILHLQKGCVGGEIGRRTTLRW